MSTKYERYLLARYLANAASRLHHVDREAVALARWVADGDNRETLRGRRGPFGRRRTRISDEDELSAQDWRRLQETLREGCSAMGAVRPDRTGQRLRRLGKSIGLSQADVDILELLLGYETQPGIESMVDDVFGHATRRVAALNVKGRALSAFLGRSAHALQGRLKDSAPLVQLGLVSIDRDGDLTIIPRLRRLVTVPGGADIDVTRLLLGATSPSELEWPDFDHVAPDRDYVETILRGALRAREKGVNILLYGPPGTGKTELCKVLAGRLGVSLYSVGESDEEGDEPSRTERLQELRLAQHLLSRDRRSLLLFDEMDDLLGDPVFPGLGLFAGRGSFRARGGGSKVFMNRLLERAPAPTLWVINDARAVSPVILRRMMFAMELRTPPPRVQGRIWARQLAQHGIEAGEEEARALAAEFHVPPGVAYGATAAACLSGGGVAAVRHGVRNLARLLSCEQPPQRAPKRFDPALIRADVDPVRLADRLAESGKRCFSLCLQGPPGTGKSAFVRYLAERLGLEVVQKRASDLLSMWVGETEKGIAAAFAEARDAQSFLVFDEADSLLAHRGLAHRTWEVSQVNEMLTWMESHPLPFACTTNFAEHLDPATLRRFTFKVALDHLDRERAEGAFRAYFGLEPPREVGELAVLTPGDFAVVHRKAEVLGSLQDPQALAAMLRAECEAKSGGRRGIGFRS